MQAEERFILQLAEGIIAGGGTANYTAESALALARKVWKTLKSIGPEAYPCLWEEGGLRFVYQWDESPQVVTVMLWDDVLWRDMAQVVVPAGVGQ